MSRPVLSQSKLLQSRLEAIDRPEPSPLSTTSCGTNISDYIGSGTSSGGQSPGIDGRLLRDILPRPSGDGRSGDEDSDGLAGLGDIDDDLDDYARDDDDEDDEDDYKMSSDRRPPFLRPSDGRSATPLLQHKPGNDRGRPGYDSPDASSSAAASPTTTPLRPTFSRGSTMRSSRSPGAARDQARKKYTYAAFFLAVSLVSFTVQTELAAYVQTELGWAKAYCMLYLTHGSWAVLWPAQLLVLRLQKRDVPWHVFWRRHCQLLRSTAVMVETRSLDVTRPSVAARASPERYIVRTTAFITCALTVAGLSWYVAVNMTSPSDLTAIYNCSAFFAYVFSVPLLREPLRLDKSLAVAVAIAGVLVVAYGDAKAPSGGDGPDLGMRFLGNIIIGVGSVLYGLYEVLYKRFACPPDGCSPGRGMIFANAFGSCIGLFTLTVLWIPLPILHMTGIEPFELPTGRTAWLLFLSVIANAAFSGSFLVLISLTSPVLSSVAALLTIFIVAISDWVLTGQPLSAAALIGGLMIIAAFVMLSWSTWREMSEDEKGVDLTDSDEEDSE